MHHPIAAEEIARQRMAERRAQADRRRAIKAARESAGADDLTVEPAPERSPRPWNWLVTRFVARPT